MEKQQPSSLGSKSQMLQLFAARRHWPLGMAFPDSVLCMVGCEIISSKCANMQNRLSKGLELKCINDYDIPNSPCAAQTTEPCCPNSSWGWHATPFSCQSMGEAKSLQRKLLSVHIYPPRKRWTWTEVEGQRVRFFISTSRFHLTQQPLSPATPLYLSKTHALRVCLQTHHLYMGVTCSQTACQGRDLNKKYVVL